MSYQSNGPDLDAYINTVDKCPAMWAQDPKSKPVDLSVVDPSTAPGTRVSPLSAESVKPLLGLRRSGAPPRTPAPLRRCAQDRARLLISSQRGPTAARQRATTRKGHPTLALRTHRPAPPGARREEMTSSAAAVAVGYNTDRFSVSGALDLGGGEGSPGCGAGVWAGRGAGGVAVFGDPVGA